MSVPTGGECMLDLTVPGLYEVGFCVLRMVLVCSDCERMMF